MSTTLTKKDIILTTPHGILPDVASFTEQNGAQELIEWFERTKKMSLRETARKAGIAHNTLLALASSPMPNPGLKTIHGLARAGQISEQSVCDAFLGRSLEGIELSDDTVKELFRQYEEIDPLNRDEGVKQALLFLAQAVARALEQQQDSQSKSSRKPTGTKQPKIKKPRYAARSSSKRD